MTRRTALAVVAAAALLMTGSAAGAEDPVRIDSGPSGATRDAEPIFAFSAAGAAECRLDDAAFQACASPYLAAPLADGPHLFEVRAAGGLAFRTFTVDTVVPAIALAEEIRSGETSAAVPFAVDDAAAETSCAVDDATAAPCGSPFRTPELTNGRHVVRVHATDAAGNLGAATARLEIAAGDVDTTIAGPEGRINDTTPEFGLASSRPDSSFACRLDEAEWAPCGSTYVAPVLAAGVHVLRARAIDAAGNVDPTPAARDFEVMDCKPSVRFGVIDARADCFRVESGTYIADGPVRMNGITFSPIAGRSLRFNPERRSISFGPIQLRVGPLVLYQGEFAATIAEDDEIILARIDLDTHSRTDGPEVNDSEGALDLTGDDGANAWGLEMKGEVVLSLTKGRTQVRGTVQLPRALADDEGRGLTGEIVVSADNDHGVQLDSAKVTAPTARVGDVELHNLWVMFAGRNANLSTPSCNAESPGLRWVGGADRLVVPTPDRLQVENVGFGFADGRFNHAEASFQRDDDGVAIGGGVRVQKVAISMCAGPPLRLEGRIGLTALPDDEGRPRLSVPDAGVLFQGGDPWSLRVEAPEALLDLGLPMRFSDLSLSYASTGAVAFRGLLDLSLGTRMRGTADHLAVSLSTRVSGFIERSRFSAAFGAIACFDGRLTVLGGQVPFQGLCTRVDAVVSSTGTAICGGLKLLDVVDFGRVGIGHRWGGPVELMAGACDMERWRVDPSATGALAAIAGRSVTLPENSRGVLVAVRGVAGPPHVVLRGPRGEVVRTAEGVRRDEQALSFTGVAARTTYIALRRPAGGRWLVEGRAGSVIEHVATARVRKAPSVSATVAGRGRTRILRYRVARVPGQVVSFVERGRGVGRTIARVGGGHGQRRFRVADGAAGRRKVVALVEQDGLPREQRTVAVFTAPGPERPGMAREVRASVGRGGLRLRWMRARGAARYGVRIALSDGRQLFFVRGPGRRSLRFAGIRRARTARVRVVALSAGDRVGRAATATIELRRSRRAR